MVQNHVLQVLALIAIDPPVAGDPGSLHDKKLEVFKSLAPVLREDFVFGQYEGYRREPKVAADSVTPTFVALKLLINNWRWQGVPFYIRSGKALARKLTAVVIQFKDVPLCVLPDQEACQMIQPNILAMRIQPDEGIQLRFSAKVPGREYRIGPAVLDFRYSDFGPPMPEAYERILFDDATHVSIAALPGMASRTLTVFSFSKTYAMTGWRLGYVVSPPPLRPVLGPTLNALTTYGVFPAVQIAGLAALKGPQGAVDTMKHAYQERRDALFAGLEGQHAIRAPKPAGAFYVFADVSAALERRMVWDLVREWLELGVAVLPGTAFGLHPERVRLSLATRKEDLVEAMRRLREHYAGTGAKSGGG
jgi:hypothetical protein